MNAPVDKLGRNLIRRVCSFLSGGGGTFPGGQTRRPEVPANQKDLVRVLLASVFSHCLLCGSRPVSG